MKKLLFCIFIVPLLFSCALSDDSSSENSPKTKGLKIEHWNEEFELYGNVDSVCVKNINEILLRSYKFDESGKVISYSQNQSNYYHTYQYDSKGLLILERIYENGKLTSEYTYEYNSDGKIVKEIIGSDLILYHYNANGQLITMIVRGDGYGYKEIYEYGGNEKIAKVTTYSPDGKELRVTKEYRYDSIGNLTEDIRKAKYRNSNVRIYYKYDTNGNMIEKLRYDESEDSNEKLLKKYDSFGNEIEEIYKTTSNTMYRNLREYDKYSNILSNVYYKNDEISESHTYDITYDSHGNPTVIDEITNRNQNQTFDRKIFNIFYRE